MDIAEVFAANLRRCRRRVRLSQEELAFRASLHRTAISKLEHAERLPKIDTLVKLASALEVEPEALLQGLSWEPGHSEPGRFAHAPGPVMSPNPK